MSEKIQSLLTAVSELEKAPIFTRADLAMHALKVAAAIIAEQSRQLAVIRSRLDDVEARTADAFEMARNGGPVDQEQTNAISELRARLDFLEVANNAE